MLKSLQIGDGETTKFTKINIISGESPFDLAEFVNIIEHVYFEPVYRIPRFSRRKNILVSSAYGRDTYRYVFDTKIVPRKSKFYTLSYQEYINDCIDITDIINKALKTKQIVSKSKQFDTTSRTFMRNYTLYVDWILNYPGLLDIISCIKTKNAYICYVIYLIYKLLTATKGDIITIYYPENSLLPCSQKRLAMLITKLASDCGIQFHIVTQSSIVFHTFRLNIKNNLLDREDVRYIEVTPADINVVMFDRYGRYNYKFVSIDNVWADLMMKQL